MAWWDTPKKNYRFKLLRDEGLAEFIRVSNVRTQPAAVISVYADGCLGLGTQLALETEKKILMVTTAEMHKAKMLSELALALKEAYDQGRKQGKSEEEEMGKNYHLAYYDIKP